MNRVNVGSEKVQILLSTFNGEKYLREQLDSYLRLDGFENVKVLIRDDGSTDGTVGIIKEYIDKYGFQLIEGRNVGVNQSVQILFDNCDLTCDYFALSDQDDVWLSDKLVKAISVLSAENTSTPLLFASLSQIVDENLVPKSSTLVPSRGISFYNAMVQNVTPGHTQVFNKALMKLVMNKETSRVLVIDWWLYLIASGIGKVKFINEFTVLHRQHGKNAVGYQSSFVKSIPARTKRVFSKHSKSISTQLWSFRNTFGEFLPNEFRIELEDYLACQSTLFKRIHYLTRTKLFRQTKIETVVFKILFLLGRYKYNNESN